MVKRLALILLTILGLVLNTSEIQDTETKKIATPISEFTEQNIIFSRPFTFVNWQRPVGPIKVALQVGHLHNDYLPNELEKLRKNDGATGGGKAEWEVNLEIAEHTKRKLESAGFIVDILPATVPPNYWADIFIAIHADGNENRGVTGFKAAGAERDITGKANTLARTIENEYTKLTGMYLDRENISVNMRYYYAFSWWRFEHAVHPLTTSVIVETGYLTNPNDRKLIVNQPEKSAEGITRGVLKFLNTQQASVDQETTSFD